MTMAMATVTKRITRLVSAIHGEPGMSRGLIFPIRESSLIAGINSASILACQGHVERMDLAVVHLSSDTSADLLHCFLFGWPDYWTSGQTADRFSPASIRRTVLETREPLASSSATRFMAPADNSRPFRISLACTALTAPENRQRLWLVPLTSGGETDRCYPANQRLPQLSSARLQRQPPRNPPNQCSSRPTSNQPQLQLRLPPPFPPSTSSTTRKTRSSAISARR
jgi:hypothetical protein